MEPIETEAEFQAANARRIALIGTRKLTPAEQDELRQLHQVVPTWVDAHHPLPEIPPSPPSPELPAAGS